MYPVRQAVTWSTSARVRPFFSVTNQVLTEQGVALPLEPGSTTTAETRLAAGNQAQVDIFGEGMRGFQTVSYTHLTLPTILRV